jgi:hypothetical protein
MITLNNPLVLANITLLGIGLDVKLEKRADKWHLCVTLEGVVWKGCWEWGGAG